MDLLTTLTSSLNVPEKQILLMKHWSAPSKNARFGSNSTLNRDGEVRKEQLTVCCLQGSAGSDIDKYDALLCGSVGESEREALIVSALNIFFFFFGGGRGGGHSEKIIIQSNQLCFFHLCSKVSLFHSVLTEP